MTSSRLIKDLMKPQNTYSHEAVREVIETIANCSSMKLDSVSMNKLWDLITMVFKWQVGNVSVQSSIENYLLIFKLAMSPAIIETTQRHVAELESYVASEGTQLQLHRVQNVLQNFTKVLSDEEKMELYQDLMDWCQVGCLPQWSEQSKRDSMLAPRSVK